MQKKLINDPQPDVAESLRGMAMAHPELRIDHANCIVYRGDAAIAGKVWSDIRRGSGHDTPHAGFHGRGALMRLCRRGFHIPGT